MGNGDLAVAACPGRSHLSTAVSGPHRGHMTSEAPLWFFLRHSPGWVFLSSGSRLQGLRVHQIMAVPGACRLMIGKAYSQTVSALHPSRCSYRRIPSQCEWTTCVPSGRIETSPQQSMSWRAFLQTQPPRGTFEGDAGLSAVQISFRGEKSGVVPRSGSS